MLSDKYKLERVEKLYGHKPAVVVENMSLKPFWDFIVQYDNVIWSKKARHDHYPEGRQCWIIDIAVPAEVSEKKQKMLESYQDLKHEIAPLYGRKNVSCSCCCWRPWNSNKENFKMAE